MLVVSGCTPHGPRELLQGKKLIDRGKYPQAVEKLLTATQILKTNAQAWNYLGLASHHAGNSVDAEKAYQQALLLDHDLSEAHYNLGCLYLEQNRTNAARNELTAFSLRRGSSAEGVLMLGLAQLRCHDAIAAEKSFNEALRLSPQHPEALNGMGLARLQRGQAGDALSFFKTALSQQPNYPPALLNAAIVSQAYLRDPRGALERYREYLALKPAPADATAVKLQVQQLEQELNPPARAAVNPPVPTPATVAPAKPSAANISQRTAVPAPIKIEQAAKPASNTTSNTKPLTNSVGPATNPEVVKLQPEPVVKPAPPLPKTQTPPVTSNQIQRSSPPTPTAGLSQPPPAPAQPGRYQYRNLLKPVPGDRTSAEKLFAQAVQAGKAHRLADAVIAYQAAIQADPAFFDACYNLAVTSTEAGNAAGALAAYETALAIRPESLDARYNFALLLRQSNYLQDAAIEFEKLLTRYPNDARAHLALGNLYADQLRDHSRARHHYTKVLEADPNNSQSLAIRYWLTEHPL